MILPWPEIIMAGGQLIGGLFNRGGSRGAINRQNEYNSPLEQVKRLREAGLPMAAMTGAGAGNQSQAQTETGSGISEGINTYIQTSLQRKQMDLIEAQIRVQDAQEKALQAGTEKTWVEALREKTASDKELDSVYNYDLIEGTGNVQPEGTTNQIGNIVREQNLRTAQQYLSENQSKAIQLEMDIKKQRNPIEVQEIRTRIDKMLTDMGVQIADLNMRKSKFPLEMQKMRYEIGNLRQEGILQQQRFKQGYKNLQLSDQHINRDSVIDSLINGMKKNGMTIGEAIGHSIFAGQLQLNPIRF